MKHGTGTHVGSGCVCLRNQAQVEIEDERTVVPQTFLLPLFKVILHNDDVHEANYVAGSLVKAVPSLTFDEAWQIMFCAHTTGAAVVIVCPKESAEYYQERIQSFGLTSTIEPE
jgi:ATP-dependent Clp protease adaptor protein ClpS